MSIQQVILSTNGVYWHSSAKDLKIYDYDKDGETFVLETLAPKIRVLKTFV